LWRLIVTPTRRGYTALCGQADLSYFRRCMGCNRLRLFEIAALADENGGSAGDVETHWCGRAR
jgi:hypothetical protein